ncbi:MAG: hypothetical protein ACYTG4_11260 [Planctomycetota bacterium]
MIQAPFRRSWTRGLALAGLLGVLAAATPVAQAQDEDIFSFELPMAPVCLEGDFPLTLTGVAGDLEGTVTLSTDVKGKLSGVLDLDGEVLLVTGKVKYRGEKATVKLAASNEESKVTLKGALGANGFAGKAKGKGDTAGKFTFVLDTSESGETRWTSSSPEPTRRSSS